MPERHPRSDTQPAGDEAGPGAAIVTGGSRGIGRAIAAALAAAGRPVGLVARGAEALQAAASEINASLGRDAAFPFAGDVTDPESVKRFARAATERLGPIAVLINAAGGAESAPYARTDGGMLRRLLDLNLLGAHNVTSLLYPGMVERGRGEIVNIASTAALEGYAYVSAYAASKHALLGLTRSLAREASGKGVRVNAVCPGFVDTPMLERSVREIVERTGRSPEEARASLGRMNRCRRLLKPEEVAEAVLWLLSEEARGLNGEAIVVDGGAAAWSQDPPLPVNPESLGPPSGYSNGMLMRAGRTLFVAGQVAWDREHRIVGGDDFAAQFDAALGNVLSVVREAGGRPDQIGRLRIFVADRDRYLAALKETGRAYRKHMGSHYPAMALVEVERLLEEGALVEIEAEAIL